MPLSCTLENGHNGKLYVMRIYHSFLHLQEERLPSDHGGVHKQSGERDGGGGFGPNVMVLRLGLALVLGQVYRFET